MFQSHIGATAFQTCQITAAGTECASAVIAQALQKYTAMRLLPNTGLQSNCTPAQRTAALSPRAEEVDGKKICENNKFSQLQLWTLRPETICQGGRRHRIENLLVLDVDVLLVAFSHEAGLGFRLHRCQRWSSQLRSGSLARSVFKAALLVVIN